MSPGERKLCSLTYGPAKGRHRPPVWKVQRFTGWQCFICPATGPAIGKMTEKQICDVGNSSATSTYFYNRVHVLTGKMPFHVYVSIVPRWGGGGGVWSRTWSGNVGLPLQRAFCEPKEEGWCSCVRPVDPMGGLCRTPCSRSCRAPQTSAPAVAPALWPKWPSTHTHARTHARTHNLYLRKLFLR